MSKATKIAIIAALSFNVSGLAYAGNAPSEQQEVRVIQTQLKAYSAPAKTLADVNSEQTVQDAVTTTASPSPMRRTVTREALPTQSSTLRVASKGHVVITPDHTDARMAVYTPKEPRTHMLNYYK